MATFFEIGLEHQLGGKNQLMRMNKMVNWELLRGYLKKVHRSEWNGQGGPNGYDTLKMYKAILLGQWHSLSDPGLEESLRVRLDFMAFTGFSMGSPIPDETTLCRFRNRLIELKLDKKLMQVVNQELEKLGIQIESAKGALVDATIVESSARPRKEITIHIDREEERSHGARDESSASPVVIEMSESKDPDARWLKKGKRSFFGYKGFVSVTQGEGYIQATHVTPAQVSEMTEFRSFIHQIPSTDIFADKGYACEENVQLLKQLGKKSRIMKKAWRNRPLTRWEHQFNRLVSHYRFRVEQAFGTLKRRFNMSRFRYFTCVKVNAELAFKAIGFNLLKAANSFS
jgi:IS5 family transposase